MPSGSGSVRREGKATEMDGALAVIVEEMASVTWGFSTNKIPIHIVVAFRIQHLAVALVDLKICNCIYH
jgi:hypothetical protein